MWNHDFRAPSAREICADVCYNAFRGTLTLREDACVYVYLCEISKNSRQKYQFTRFFLTDFFSPSWNNSSERVLRWLDSYFETILLFDNKFFKDRI
jgi:hypothetical protein